VFPPLPFRSRGTIFFRVQVRPPYHLAISTHFAFLAFILAAMGRGDVNENFSSTFVAETAKITGQNKRHGARRSIWRYIQRQPSTSPVELPKMRRQTLPLHHLSPKLPLPSLEPQSERFGSMPSAATGASRKVCDLTMGASDAGYIALRIPKLAGFVDVFVREADVSNRWKLFLHGRAWLPVLGNLTPLLRRVILIGQTALRHCLKSVAIPNTFRSSLGDFSNQAGPYTYQTSTSLAVNSQVLTRPSVNDTKDHLTALPPPSHLEAGRFSSDTPCLLDVNAFK